MICARDLDWNSFTAKLRRMGVECDGHTFRHPDLNGGHVFELRVRSYRQTVSDLAVLLAAARARQRGGRVVLRGYTERVRRLVAEVA